MRSRVMLACLALVTLSGIVLGWNKGQLPQRDLPASTANAPDETATDLQLYRQIVTDVRSGANYYDSARTRLPAFGFPIDSPFNWRLPTYAWLFAALPNRCWIQALLALLSVTALSLAFVAQCKASGIGAAAVSSYLLLGVAGWAIDGEAYLAQEVWVAVLMLLSISAYSLSTQYRAIGALAVTTGIAALFFRELALPFCVVTCGMAAWKGRRLEAAAWLAGILLFFAYYAWHVLQVRAQLTELGATTGAGLSQWLRFGGLDFVLLTARMNSLLFSAPGWLLWLYLVASLYGLASRRDESSQVACIAALLFVAAFAVVGRSENFYWGLMYAALLPAGIAHFPAALCATAGLPSSVVKRQAPTSPESFAGAAG